MAGLIGIGLVIVVAMAVLRALFASSQPSAPPQIIYLQAAPQKAQEESDGSAGALIFLLLAIVAAISFFPG